MKLGQNSTFFFNSTFCQTFVLQTLVCILVAASMASEAGRGQKSISFKVNDLLKKETRKSHFALRFWVAPSDFLIPFQSITHSLFRLFDPLPGGLR